MGSNAGGGRHPSLSAFFAPGYAFMKITKMIHDTVVAFKPERHPVYALIALSILMSAFVVLVVFGGVGAGIATTRAVAAVRAIS